MTVRVVSGWGRKNIRWPVCMGVGLGYRQEGGGCALEFRMKEGQ